MVRGRHLFALVLTFALLALLVSSGSSATDGSSPKPTGTGDVARLTDGAEAPALPEGAEAKASARVEGDVLAAFSDEEQVPVIVRLREQADVPSLRERARVAGRARGRSARVRTVVEELQATAARTQPDVRRLLRAEEDAAGRGGCARTGSSTASPRPSAARPSTGWHGIRPSRA